jgi:hypothetical protein
MIGLAASRNAVVPPVRRRRFAAVSELILVAELRELTEYLARTCFAEIAVPQATADLVDVAATASPAGRPPRRGRACGV